MPLPALENAKVRGQTLPALLFKGEGRSVETPFKSDCTDTETPVAGELLTAPTELVSPITWVSASARIGLLLK